MRFSDAPGAKKPAPMMAPRGAGQSFGQPSGWSGYLGPGRPTTLFRPLVAVAKWVLGKFRAYTPNVGDRQVRVTMDLVSVERIETALYQAWLGYLTPLAEIYDLMPASNPILRGIRNQLKAGVKRVTPEFTPPPNVEPGRAALAQTIADDVRGAASNPDAPLSKLIGQHVECVLRGGGLIEPLWKLLDDGRWTWTGFQLVPQHRFRYDRYTAEPCFAESAFQYFGAPVSSFPRGTFIVVNPEKDVPDFSKRGTYRAILGDWFAMQNCASWWQEDLERLGSPIVAATYDQDADREVMNNAIQNMGANGGLTYRKGGDVKIIEKAARTGPKGSAHNEFETTRAQRLSIAFLGATQTVTVDANTGSQNSSDNMADVRGEVLTAHWDDIIADVRRDLIQLYVELNYGIENADLTPIMTVDLEEAADAGTTLDAFTKADKLGLEVGETYARKRLKWPAPAPGEKVLKAPAPPAFGAAPGVAPAIPAAPGARPTRVAPEPGKPAEKKQEAAA